MNAKSKAKERAANRIPLLDAMFPQKKPCPSCKQRDVHRDNYRGLATRIARANDQQVRYDTRIDLLDGELLVYDDYVSPTGETMTERVVYAIESEQRENMRRLIQRVVPQCVISG